MIRRSFQALTPTDWPQARRQRRPLKPVVPPPDRALAPLPAREPATALPGVRTDLGLTVLIPAYNEGKFIADTVRSVQGQTLRPDRIIVIDDCSTDDTGAAARACGPEIEVVRPPKNCGSKASALNFALAMVQTRYTLAIDADTTLAPDAIEKLMARFGPSEPESERVGAVCGMVVPRHVRTLWERGRYVEYLYAFTFYKPIQDYYGRPLIASGCFTAFRTDLLQRLGGWSMRTVGEDMDLTWSLYREGMIVRFVEEAVCYPVEPHTFHFLNKQLKRWSHGFAQCVKVHWKDVLEVPVLRTIVAVALWDAVTAILGLFVLLPLLAVFVHPLFLLGYVLDVPTIAIPVLIKAAQRREIRPALASLPAFFVMRFVNSVYVARALWNEFVARRPLTTFEKGH